MFYSILISTSSSLDLASEKLQRNDLVNLFNFKFCTNLSSPFQSINFLKLSSLSKSGISNPQPLNSSVSVFFASSIWSCRLVYWLRFLNCPDPMEFLFLETSARSNLVQTHFTPLMCRNLQIKQRGRFPAPNKLQSQTT